MAWIKIPPEHHPLFMAALPPDPRIETIKMFGGIAAKVNGNFFAGLFGPSAMVLLDDKDTKKALALPGAAPFDPMGKGMKSDKVQLPVDVFLDPKKLRSWIVKAFDHAAALPTKTKAAKKGAAAASKRARPTKKSR